MVALNRYQDAGAPLEGAVLLKVKKNKTSGDTLSRVWLVGLVGGGDATSCAAVNKTPPKMLLRLHYANVACICCTAHVGS